VVGGSLLYKNEVILSWSIGDEIFVAEMPELTGCMAFGDTQEIALQNISSAMELWIDSVRQFVDPLLKLKGEGLMLA